MFRNLNGLANLMKNAGQIGPRLQQVKSDLESRSVVGKSASNLVSIHMNGVGKVSQVVVDPSLVSSEGHDELQNEIREATNLAIEAAKQLHLEALKHATEELGLPGMDGLLSQLAD